MFVLFSSILLKSDRNMSISHYLFLLPNLGIIKILYLESLLILQF